MKTLNTQEISCVSGAGSMSVKEFGQYLQMSKAMGLDALHPAGAKEMFINWCKEFKIDPAYTAKTNGWSL